MTTVQVPKLPFLLFNTFYNVTVARYFFIWICKLKLQIKMVRSGYSIGESSAPARNVKRLQFGLLSPDEIVSTHCAIYFLFISEWLLLIIW